MGRGMDEYSFKKPVCHDCNDLRTQLAEATKVSQEWLVKYTDLQREVERLKADNERLREAAIRVSCFIEAEEPEQDSRMAGWASQLRAVLTQPESPQPDETDPK